MRACIDISAEVKYHKGCASTSVLSVPTIGMLQGDRYAVLYTLHQGLRLCKKCVIIVAKGIHERLTKVCRVVCSRAAETNRRKEGDELLGGALKHTQALRHYVDVVEQLEQRCSRLMDRAYYSAALSRQSSQQ